MNFLINFFRNAGQLVPDFDWNRDVAAAWIGATAVDSGWTVVLGMLVAIACGLIGCYLVVQRLALIGDAISHTVFLGIVITFLLTGQLSGPPLFFGAAASGILTSAAISGLHRSSRIKEDAAIGIVFTTLFALGIVLLTVFARDAHLDPEHALLGDIAFALQKQVPVGQWLVPVSVLQMGGVAAGIILLIALFQKELLAVSFDGPWSAAVGLHPRLVHYGLMTALSVTVVGAFSMVGAILVVAMLIAPAAIAYLLTDRLPRMFWLAGLSGALAALLGFQTAFWLDVSISGAMVCAECGLFTLAFLCGPRQGVIPTAFRRWQVRANTAAEDLLRLLLKRGCDSTAQVCSREVLQKELELSRGRYHWACFLLRRRGWIAVQPETGSLALTERGLPEAQRLDRAHRLWETYLVDRVGLASDHVHPTAETLEHLVNPQWLDRLDDLLGHPEVDPHGTPIPRSAAEAAPGEYPLSQLRVGEQARILGLQSTAIPSPEQIPDDFTALQLPLGEIVTVTQRSSQPPRWTIRLQDGRQLELSHRQADALRVRLHSPPPP